MAAKNNPTPSEKNSFLDAALKYAAAGFPVFPCEVKGKAPEGRLAPNGFKDATTNPKVIKRWWSNGHDYNIGLVPPKGMAILDIDPRNGGSTEGLPRGLQQRSGGEDGGTHIVLKDVPKKLRGKLRKGIDIKKNGYVIAEPSIHPDTGKRYRWLNGGFDAAKIQRWPEGLTPERRKSKKAEGTHNPLTPSQLRRVLNEISPHDYDDWIAVGQSMKQDYPDSFDLWVKWSAKSKKFPGEGEARTKWRSFRGEGRGTGTLIHMAGGKVPKTSAKEDFKDESPEVREEVEKGKDRRGRVATTNLASVKSKRVEWLMPGYIAKGMLHCVAGYGGEGKSNVVSAIIASLTKGKNPVDGKRLPDGPSKVLMVTEEPLAYQTVPRLEMAGADLHKIDTIQKIEEKVDGRKRTRAWNLQDHVEQVKEIFARDPAYRLFVIDPIGSYMTGKKSRDIDTWKDTDVRHVLRPWQELAEKLNIAILFIAHFNKGKSARAAEKVTGSGAFTTTTRFTYVVVRPPSEWLEDKGISPPRQGGADRVMVCVKRNVGQESDLLIFSCDPVSGSDVPEVKFKGTLPTEYQREVEEIAMGGGGVTSVKITLRERARNEIDGNPGISTKKLAEAFGTGLSNILRVLKDMEATGDVVRIRRGSIQQWYLPGKEFEEASRAR